MEAAQLPKPPAGLHLSQGSTSAALKRVNMSAQRPAKKRHPVGERQGSSANTDTLKMVHEPMLVDQKRSVDLAEKTSKAERLLVLKSFREAEKASLDILQNAMYLPKSRFEQQRAACVYIQAIYEQDR